MDIAAFPQFAIIVAGGSGSRMGTAQPKQFIPMGGLPILMHTINCFRAYAANLPIVLVLPEKDIATWTQLCTQYSFASPGTVVAGGATRFQSVRKGLQSIHAAEGLVAVHDGVRPFVPVRVIKQGFAVALAHNCAATAVPLKDSIRQVREDGTSQSLDRNRFQLMQTPQTFRLSVLRKSYEQPEQPQFTDDASVAEQAGYTITLLEGSYRNIKITTPEDLLWAEALVKHSRDSSD